MDVKRMSKSLMNKLQQNLRPLSSHLLPLQNKKQAVVKNIADVPNTMKRIDIGQGYKAIKQNTVLDNKSNIKIITCLKSAQNCWQTCLNSSNKNGQLFCAFENRLKIIQSKYQQELSKLIVHGSMERFKQAKDILKPMIQYLEKKSKKFKEHQNQFKVVSRKKQQDQHESEERQDEIKDEMIDLVQKFKKFAVNIQQNLTGDNNVIKQIEESQNKHLDSLSNKTSSMQQIIKQQKLGFFQLVGMGIFAIVMWVIGLMIIIIV